MSTSSYLSSSIGRKQIVAVTGLLLIGFLIGHLAGNLFIFGGPDAFNGYAHKLGGLRPWLYLIEIPLLLIFLIHIYFTAQLVRENIQARRQRYQSFEPKGHRSFATRIMPYTGIIVLAFVVWHLLDFTFTDKYGARSVLADGQSYELYGVVYNSFSNPIHSLLYIIAMFAIGFHLAHGVRSFMQTFGFRHPRYTPMVQKLSNGFGLFIALGYSSIPVYILIQNSLR